MSSSDLVHDVHHSRICGAPDTYCGHPYQDGIFDFGGGEVAVLHKHAPCDYASQESIGHAVVHSRAKIVMQRSMDGGDTWEEGHSVVWDESASLEQRMAFLRSTGPRGEIDLSSSDSAIFFARTRLHDEMRETEMQTFSIRSADRGHTWERHPIIFPKPHVVDPGVPIAGLPIYRDGVPLIELSDGYLVSIFYPEGENAPMLYGTGDNGLTWDYLSTGPSDTSGYGRIEYPSVLQVPDGRLLLFTTNNQGTRNCLQVAESVDGYSWSGYRPIVRVGTSPWLSRPVVGQSTYQLPGNVLYRSPWPMLLRDGRIAVIFARRKPPNGIGLIVSEDSGSTWSDEVILRDDAPSSDLGYPVATELDDERIFTAYYFNDELGGEFGGPRFIAGTHFRLK